MPKRHSATGNQHNDPGSLFGVIAPKHRRAYGVGATPHGLSGLNEQELVNEFEIT